MQHEPHLVGEWRAATGAIGSKLAFGVLLEIGVTGGQGKIALPVEIRMSKVNEVV
jgi:hypothetical protein